MIQHVKTFGHAIDDFPVRDETERVEDEEFGRSDASLDILLKHAFKTEPAGLNPEHAWQKFSRRVQGPFGTAGLEAPDFSSIEAELLSSGGRVQQAPFVLNDRIEDQNSHMERTSAIDCLWSMLRPNASGRPHGVNAWMLG